MIDLVPCEDGHSQERSLLHRVLDKVETQQIWVADRNFCTAGFFAGIVKRGSRFVIRKHKSLPYRTARRRQLVGKAQGGSRVYEQQVIIWDEKDQPIYVREVSARRHRAA